MRLFFVAGESSGDLHGAHLIRALRERRPDLTCEGYGGPRMQAAGMDLRHDLASDAIMGFVEVVRHLRPIRRLFVDALAHLGERRPDAVVLIDYPGFNIRFAKALGDSGIPVIYYISPQVWAWKQQRIHDIARTCTRMIVIFPFEEALYRDAGMDCVYVGHPLVDAIAGFDSSGRFAGERVLALLPGSRRQEVARMLPVMLETARALVLQDPGLRVVVASANGARLEEARAIAGAFAATFVAGETYEVLSGAHCAMVTSGTATVETALFGVPFAILYKTNALTYAMARRLVRVPYIGMANLLAGRCVAREFVQDRAVPAALIPEMQRLCFDTTARAQAKDDLALVRAALGEGGASARAADAVLEALGT